jgi:hypothetical protein
MIFTQQFHRLIRRRLILFEFIKAMFSGCHVIFANVVGVEGSQQFARA